MTPIARRAFLLAAMAPIALRRVPKPNARHVTVTLGTTGIGAPALIGCYRYVVTYRGVYVPGQAYETMVAGERDG